MSNRRPIPEATQHQVLASSRRRCAVCYGLNRDVNIKQGQIAHLDQKNSNSILNNLVFLCFDHHDQYDSSTKQSKNLSLMEVRSYREELYRDISAQFSVLPVFGSAGETYMNESIQTDKLTGHYIRNDDFAPSELKISRLVDGRYHVAGEALWGTTREYGPNMGDFEGIAQVSETDPTILSVIPSGYQDESYVLTLQCTDTGLTASENDFTGIFGMNVTFSGNYERL